MLYDITVPQFIKMLQNLEIILDKGAHYADIKKFDMSVLLNDRLAPDMFNLTRQIQIACDSAKLGVALLCGKEAPVHEDKETTLAELKARIQSVISYLRTFKPSDFQGAEERKISRPRWEGKWLNGHEYAIQHVVPNVFFHITTTYAILRKNGVDVGKKDYLGELPYKR